MLSRDVREIDTPVGLARAHVESVAQEIGKVAAGPAARVEHTPATVESPAKDLIEKIDIDVAESRSQLRGDGKHAPIIPLAGSEPLNGAVCAPGRRV